VGRRFYCRVLGLPEIHKPASLTGPGGSWLRVGDRPIHIGVEKGVNRNDSKARQVSNLEGWKPKIATPGIEIIENIPPSGHDRFESRGPLGNRIEFLQRR
jgi:hypothetical protein